MDTLNNNLNSIPMADWVAIVISILSLILAFVIYLQDRKERKIMKEDNAKSRTEDLEFAKRNFSHVEKELDNQKYHLEATKNILDLIHKTKDQEQQINKIKMQPRFSDNPTTSSAGDGVNGITFRNVGDIAKNVTVSLESAPASVRIEPSEYNKSIIERNGEFILLLFNPTHIPWPSLNLFLIFHFTDNIGIHYVQRIQYFNNKFRTIYIDEVKS